MSYQVGDRVRIIGSDLTGVIVEIGHHLWVRVEQSPTRNAWMLPREALEPIASPPPVVFPDEYTAAWNALVSEVYHAISDEAATAKSITRAVRNHLANEASDPRRSG